MIPTFTPSLVKNMIFGMVSDFNLTYKFCAKQYLHLEDYKHSNDVNFLGYAWQLIINL
jgi:hypothetical protein